MGCKRNNIEICADGLSCLGVQVGVCGVAVVTRTCPMGV